MSKPVIVYVYAGRLERGPSAQGRYRWAMGWSEGGKTQPWLTRREAQADAARRGARAVFTDEDQVFDVCTNCGTIGRIGEKCAECSTLVGPEPRNKLRPVTAAEVLGSVPSRMKRPTGRKRL